MSEADEYGPGGTYDDNSDPQKHSQVTLEAVEQAFEEEVNLWHQMGIALDNLTHSQEAIFTLRCQVQALTNIVLKHICSEDELNIEFFTVMRDSMKGLREEKTRAKLATPTKVKVLDPSGNEIEL